MFDPNIGEYTYKYLKEILQNKFGFTTQIDEKGKRQPRIIKSSLYSLPKPAVLHL